MTFNIFPAITGSAKTGPMIALFLLILLVAVTVSSCGPPIKRYERGPTGFSEECAGIYAEEYRNANLYGYVCDLEQRVTTLEAKIEVLQQE